MSTSTQTAPPMSAPPGLANGHTESPNHTTPPMQSVASSKKGKAKKEKLGPDETSKLLAAKISQLEQDAAGEKDQDAEIGESDMGCGMRICWRPCSSVVLLGMKFFGLEGRENNKN